MKNLILAFLGLLITPGFSKDKKYELGEVTVKELEISECAFDKEADAYVMFDKGHIFFDYSKVFNDLIYILDRELKIKITSEGGVDAGNVVIDLYKQNHRKEEVQGLKVYTYNLINGKVKRTKMDRDNVIIEEVSKYKNRYKIAVPNVKKGSVIEIKYRVTSPFLYNLNAWHFQSDKPVEYSRLKIDIPEFLDYSRNMRGYVAVQSYPYETKTQSFTFHSVNRPISAKLVQTSKRDISTYNFINNVYQFKADSVPAFKDEPFLASRKNFISALHFELRSIQFRGELRKDFSSEWLNIDKMLVEEESFGAFAMGKSKQAREILEVILNGTENETEKLTKIYYSLRGRLHWNGYFDWTVNDNTSNLWEKRSGSSADLNLLLVQLLNNAGLEAYPVMVSTRSNGYVYTTRPSIEQFNHVIAAVKIGEDLIPLDLTGQTNPPGLLPVHDLNGQARVIKKTTGEWISLKGFKSHTDQYFFDVHVDETGHNITCKSIWRLNDNAALSLNNTLLRKEGSDEQLNYFAEKYPSIDFDSIKFGENTVFTGKLELKLNFSASSCTDQIGDKLLVKPYILQDDYKNPFLKDERVYPIDYSSPVQKSFMITLHTPEGYEVSSVPETSKIMLPDGAGVFLYQANDLGKIVQINGKFELSEDLFPSESYPLLKQFYALAESKLAETVVFVKKS